MASMTLAEVTSSTPGEWEFQLAPYMWFLSASGDVTAKGQESDLDLSFSDIWDAAGLIGYRFALFSKKNNTAVVFGGYRARYQDDTDGSGDDKFEWDVTLHGPLLGLSTKF